MAERIIMPKAGMAMEEGTIVRWMKKVGDQITKGEPIAEIETDKITMELEAEVTGTLIQIVHKDGETVPVTQTIAWVGAAGEKPAAAEPAAAPPAQAARAAEPPVHTAAQPARGAAPAPAPRAAPAAAPAPVRLPAPDGRVPATPAARRLAAEKGVSLASVPGSGPLGAVRAADVEKAAAAFGAAGTGTAAALFIHADVTQLTEMTGRINAAGDLVVTASDFLVRAAASALLDFPALGQGGGIVLAAADGTTVLFPEAARMSLGGIARARAGAPASAAARGAALTITSLAELGISAFMPAVEPPQRAALGAGCIREERVGGGSARRLIMEIGLAHTLGAGGTLPAAGFLGRMRLLLENPVILLA
jgi:pyruvate dehydrogenase E2 component (dihydrolipoamide acetyltransferase)